MSTGIRSEATRSVVVVNGVDRLAVNDDGSMELLTPAANPTGNDIPTAGQTLGLGQTWQDLTASRALGATYTNTTGRPIMVSVVMYTLNSATVSQLTVGGVVVAKHGANIGGGPNSNLRTQMTAVVPAGASYSATGTSLDTWAELR